MELVRNRPACCVGVGVGELGKERGQDQREERED
jgi:hypothetical protein